MADRFTALAGTVVVLSLAACAAPEPAPEEDHEPVHAAHWGYEDDNGPGKWGAMNPAWALCAEGAEQSPIDLTSATETELPTVEIHKPGDREGVFGALDNGHSIQINTEHVATMSVSDETYALAQFHFHAPSEHTVDGESFPMEMHLVHQAEDGTLAVVGVLIEEGADNPAIAPLWAQLAGLGDSETPVQVPPEFVEQVFFGDDTGVYHYRGSLTTPPCSEGVSWYVRGTPVQLSEDQIAAFTAIYDHNNRPVQALNERALYVDRKPTVTIN